MKKNEKIKILHLLASNVYSGAENVACTIIENTKDEYESVYCSPKGDIQKKLEIINIPYFPLNKLTYKEVKNVIKKFNPDIIHAHDYRASCLASLFSKKCKVISHIHGNNIKMNYFNHNTLLFKLLSKFFSKIIWVSDSAFDNFYYKENLKDKSIILYNVIDSNKIEEKSHLLECKENYDLIFLGRLAYPKDPTRLIEISKVVKEKIPKLKVAIVGDGNDRETLEQLVEQYNLKDTVSFLGYQENPYPILKKAKILIMTSIYEGTPMCALEALSFGLPIVSTPVDGLKKIIKNNYNGFLYESNEELSKSIIEILNDKNLIQKLSNNAKKEFKKINSLDKYIKIIKNAYLDK